LQLMVTRHLSSVRSLGLDTVAPKTGQPPFSVLQSQKGYPAGQRDFSLARNVPCLKQGDLIQPFRMTHYAEIGLEVSEERDRFLQRSLSSHKYYIPGTVVASPPASRSQQYRNHP
jgi:hypothetical protein